MPLRLTGCARLHFMCFCVCISTDGKRHRCGTFLCEFVWCSDDAPVVAHIDAPFRSASLRGSAQGGIGGCSTVGCARPCRARLPTAVILRRCRGLSVDVESLCKMLCCSRQRACLPTAIMTLYCFACSLETFSILIAMSGIENIYLI